MSVDDSSCRKASTFVPATEASDPKTRERSVKICKGAISTCSCMLRVGAFPLLRETVPYEVYDAEKTWERA